MTHARLGLLLLLGLAAATAAAEDCSRPKNPTERLICSNDRVSDAKEQMTVAFFLAYRRLVTDEDREAMRRQQREWELKVRDACGDVRCLLDAFADRALELQQN